MAKNFDDVVYALLKKEIVAHSGSITGITIGSDDASIDIHYGEGKVDNVPFPNQLTTEQRQLVAKFSVDPNGNLLFDGKDLVEKADIVTTTLDENSTNDDIYGGKAIYDAIVDAAPFKFGIDDKGNYGYYKAGADTVTPFRVEPTQFATGVIANLSSESIVIDISKRYLVSVSLKYTEPNDTLRLNNFYVSDGIVQELIPSSLGYGACTLSGNTLTIENTNTTITVDLYICYTILEI